MKTEKYYVMDKIVLCGIQEQGKDIIEFLFQNNIRVTNIVTITKELAIKNKCESTWFCYEFVAAKYNIPIYYAENYKLTSQKDIDFFKTNRFDILLLGGWQRLISGEILNTIKFPIGQHGSSDFLPKGRGRSPLNWAIINGNRRLIWNIFLLDDGVDSGDIIDTQIININDWDDCKTLYQKVAIVVKSMLVRSIPKLLTGELIPKKQIGEPTYHPKRTPEDGIINWEEDVDDIYNLIRAVTRSYPGAFTMYNDEKIMIWKAQIFDSRKHCHDWHYSKDLLNYYQDRQNGEIVEVFDNEFVVKCKNGLLLITEHEDKSVFKGKQYKKNLSN